MCLKTSLYLPHQTKRLVWVTLIKMENLTQAQQTKVFEFLNGLMSDVCITDYVNVEDINIDNAYNSIQEKIDDNNGFDIEIIYYSKAIEYLSKNDPSLKESLGIASDYGFELKNLTSETLASLLASQNARENFYGLESEIETFFEELKEEIEERTQLIIDTFNERYFMEIDDIFDIELYFNDEASEGIRYEEKDAFKKEFELNF